jgi:class 3 adenylate cyclase
MMMLFADVKRRMDLAEQVDPEEWHKILDRFFQFSPTACTASRERLTSTPKAPPSEWAASPHGR